MVDGMNPSQPIHYPRDLEENVTRCPVATDDCMIGLTGGFEEMHILEGGCNARSLQPRVLYSSAQLWLRHILD